VKGDWVIVAANSVGGALSSVLAFKIRDIRSDR
jgi:hypothetical protein